MSPLPNADDLIRLYSLKPHPEGCHFARTYESSLRIQQANLPSSFRGDRFSSTAIYYLFKPNEVSRLHRIASDEMWHYYLGQPIKVCEIRPDGKITETIIGPDVLKGHQVQHVVKAGTWFGAYPLFDEGYAFGGCTVTPGFDFAEFEMGKRAELIAQYPHAKRIIEKLTD